MPKIQPQNMPLFFVSQTGCLLPALIVLNIMFGWLFFKFSTWLLIEGIMILLFVMSARFMMKKIVSSSFSRRENVVDVEGETVEEKKRLK